MKVISSKLLYTCRCKNTCLVTCEQKSDREHVIALYILRVNYVRLSGYPRIACIFYEYRHCFKVIV